ncbi:hypothetical protein C1H46_003851 [Malus baccata]|uniref:Uncharacterized protein n=1 Tax=Malus baccata TaxID=106549 RepID=A0A540NIT1_MALBA|nr:hypothetical protein C1H46_003851 [Malus baccata]
MISAEVVNIGDEACEVVAGTISTGLLARQHQKVEITLTLLEQGGTAGRYGFNVFFGIQFIQKALGWLLHSTCMDWRSLCSP